MPDESTADAATNPIARHGKLSYVQVPAPDAARSARFYEAVFGWTIRGSADHVSFEDASGELIGAFIPGLEVAKEPGIFPYIYVDSVGETLRSILANGGTVVREPYAEEDLTVANFADPAGNVLGVWQFGGHEAVT